MTLIEFNDLGKYVMKKKSKLTIFRPALLDIENEDYKYIKLIGDTCCIRHKEDSSKRAIMYKTLNGAKKYVDKWCF